MTLRGVPITMITRPMGKSGANDLWRRAREQAGVEDLAVERGQTLRAATRSLKAGRVLGYVIDQNQPRRRAIFPTFFGVPAATAPTPAVLAMRTGAAVVFTLSVPLGDGRHKVVIEGPIEPPDTGDRDRGRARLHAGPERPAGALGPPPPRSLVLAPPPVEDPAGGGGAVRPRARRPAAHRGIDAPRTARGK